MSPLFKLKPIYPTNCSQHAKEVYHFMVASFRPVPLGVDVVCSNFATLDAYKAIADGLNLPPIPVQNSHEMACLIADVFAKNAHDVPCPPSRTPLSESASLLMSAYAHHFLDCNDNHQIHADGTIACFSSRMSLTCLYEFSSETLYTFYRDYITNLCMEYEEDMSDEAIRQAYEADNGALFDVFESLFGNIYAKYGFLPFISEDLEDLFFYHHRMCDNFIHALYRVMEYNGLDDHCTHDIVMACLPTLYTMHETLY